MTDIVEFVVKRKKRDSVENPSFLLPFGDPPGARTQDPHIKSVMLYLLS